MQRARELQFTQLDDVVADAQSLLRSGYTKSGNWTLGQVSSHVADWASYPMVGFPIPPLPLRAIFWTLRKTGVAGRMAEKIKQNGFSPGMATAPQTVQASDYSDSDGVSKLQDVLFQLKDHTDTLHASPLFGQMDHQTCVHVTLLHAAHHFSFLAPATAE